MPHRIVLPSLVLLIISGCSQTDPALVAAGAGGAAGGAAIGQAIDSDIGAPIGAGIGGLVGIAANQATGAALQRARAEAMEEGRRQARAEMLDQEWQRRAIEGEGNGPRTPHGTRPLAHAPLPTRVARPQGVYEGIEFAPRHDLPINGEPIR